MKQTGRQFIGLELSILVLVSRGNQLGKLRLEFPLGPRIRARHKQGIVSSNDGRRVCHARSPLHKETRLTCLQVIGGQQARTGHHDKLLVPLFPNHGRVVTAVKQHAISVPDGFAGLQVKSGQEGTGLVIFYQDHFPVGNDRR